MVYGNRGIDTQYEREKIKYRPHLIYPDRESKYPMSDEAIVQISRAIDFSIGEVIVNYNKLIEKITELLNTIEERNPDDDFAEYLSVLKKNELDKIIEAEKKHSDYYGAVDYEVYTILYFMRESIQKRVEFIDENYRTLITSRTEEDEILEDEMSSINEWIKTEYDLAEAYEKVMHEEEDYDIHAKIEALEEKRRELEQFHTSLSDIAYVHQNRYHFFETLIDIANTLVNYSNTLIGDSVDVFIENLLSLGSLKNLEVHLMLQFKEFRRKLDALKNQYLLIDDEKEQFASEKQNFYHKVMLEANNEIKNWLYDQVEGVSETFDLFASIIVDSLKETKKTYDETLADLLNFYQTEANFYERQLNLIQKKEEIRQFARIIEDLEDADSIDPEWIQKYLEDKGYASIGS